MITVVVPVYNERDNINALLAEIHKASFDAPISEVIYIDDASTDGTLDVLKRSRDIYPFLRVIHHSIKSGQSAAFLTGVNAAGNNLIVFMDGDGQNNPADIRKLYEHYQKRKNPHKKIMVAGQREKRSDNFLRRISSRLANRIRSAVLNDGVRDTGCSLKMITREDYLVLPFFNHMHRFLPALLKRDNVEILTVDVSHRPRMHGTSKYGFWNRFWVGITDLVGVRWLLLRAKPIQLTLSEII